jgi:hypothetical protein
MRKYNCVIFVRIGLQKKFQLFVLLIGWDGQQFLREYSGKGIRRTLYQNLIFQIERRHGESLLFLFLPKMGLLGSQASAIYFFFKYCI